MLKFYQRSDEVRSRAQRSCFKIIPQFEGFLAIGCVPGRLHSWVARRAVIFLAVVCLLCLQGCVWKSGQTLRYTRNPGKASALGKPADTAFEVTGTCFGLAGDGFPCDPDTWKDIEVDPAPPNLGGTPPYFPFLVRQPDCSLTQVVVDNTGAVQLQNANYQDILHQHLQVPTTADKWANGCHDPTTSVGGQGGAVVAQLAGGNTVFAAISLDGVDVITVSSAGSPVSAVDYPAGTGTPSAMATADLNGDGILDIVVASSTATGTGSLSVLLGNGDGTFKTGQSVSFAVSSPGIAPPVGVTIDDVNGDKKLDLVAVTEAPSATASGITTFLGNGDGTFHTPGTSGPNGAGGYVSVTADFNGDGKKDIVTSFGQILLGNGDGTFSLTAQTLPEGQQAGVAAADFNLDGKIDLAFANTAAATVDVYFGKGDGTFAYSASYPSIYGATTIEASDLDGDGSPDLFVGTASGGIYTSSSNSESRFQPLLNFGDGTFGPTRAYFPGPPSAEFGLTPLQAYVQYAAANFTGSGKPDLLMPGSNAAGTASVLSVLKGNGDGTFNPTPIQTQLSNPSAPRFMSAMAAGDMNGDGKSDIVFAWTADSFGTNPTISVALGKGDGTFQTQQDYSLPAEVLDSVHGTSQGLALADLRGTGKPDVVFITGAALYVMLNNGNGTLAAPTLVDSQPDMNFLAAQSLRGNGKSDIVVAQRCTSSTSAGSALVYLGKGDGTFQAATPLSAGFGCPNVLAVADMNADKKLDLVVAGADATLNATSGYVSVLLGNGDGTFQSAKTTAIPPFLGSLPTGIAVGAVFQNNSSAGVILGQLGPFGAELMLAGNGDGTFNTTNELERLLGINSKNMQFIDLTGQGLLDLIVTSGGSEANGAQLSVQIYVTRNSTQLPGTTTALTSSVNPSLSGQSVTFTATITGPAGNTTVPTGSVNFLDGTTTLGSGTLNGSGVATYSTSTLSAGSHSITAGYGGDANFSGSTSAVLTQVVNTAVLLSTTTALTSSPNPSAPNQSVTFTASVAGPSGATATPTGTVTFLDVSTSLGSGTLDATAKATFSTSTLSAGSHSITARYSGDATYTGSTSSAVTQVVGTPTFSLSINPTTVTVSAGSSGSTTVTVTPASGFNQQVSFACAGLPTASSCGFSPATVTPNGTAAASTTLSVATDVAAAVKARTVSSSRGWAPGAGAILAVILFGLGGLTRARRRATRILGTLALLGVLGLITNSCGGGSSSGPKTPKGSSTITVSAAAGSLNQSTTFTLVVQ
jgi:hypothetical protein